MWLLTSPLLLIGLVSLPIVVGIYFLRNRARRRRVSSLLLWSDQQRARQGGRRVRKIQTPLLLLLELLVLALLVMGAAGPRVRRGDVAWPTVIVLDDSFSMRAGLDGDTPRERAMEDLRAFIETESGFPIQFIAAGPTPEVIGSPVYEPREALETLEQWGCHRPSSDLESAVALGGVVQGSGSKLLVVTDHAPPEELKDGRMQWWAFGFPHGNLAIVNAARSLHEEEGRLLVELANFSDQKVAVPLQVVETDTAIGEGAPRRAIDNSLRQLDPGQTLRIVWNVPATIEDLLIETPDDPLPLDNRAMLLPPRERTVRVDVRVSDAALQEAVTKAVAASRQTLLTGERPELVITDGAGGGVSSARWVLRISVERGEDAASYTGPFVVDRSSGLTEGMQLDGVIWGAGDAEEMTGVPIISAGNVPLLTEQVSVAGGRIYRMRIVPELSTVTQSPNWPILFANIVRERSMATPGLLTNHARLGTLIHYVAAEGDTNWNVTSPDGRETPLPVRDAMASYRVDEIGRHETTSESGAFPFTASAMNADESDLRTAETGRWGTWIDERTTVEQFRSIVWALVVAALALLALHMALIAGRRRRIEESSGGDELPGDAYA